MICFLGSGGLVMVSMSLQHSMGFSALDNGVALIPFAGISVFAMLAVRRMSRFIVKNLHVSISAGFAISALGHLFLSLGTNAASFVETILPGLSLLAVGNMIAITASTNEVYRDVPPGHRGIAAALTYVFRMMFQSLGMALMVSAAKGDLNVASVPLQSFANSYRIGAGICMLGVLVTITTLRRQSPALLAENA